MSKRTTLSRKKIFLSKPKRKDVWRIWHFAWLDSGCLLGKRGVNITQSEIRDLFRGADIEPDAEEHRVVPKNPCTPLTAENVTIVSPDSRKTLVAMWKIAKSGDCEVSATAVEWLSHAGHSQQD
jgi:hypothetical protein